MASLDQVLTNLKVAMTDTEKAIANRINTSQANVDIDIKATDGKLLPGLVKYHHHEIADGVTPSKHDFRPKE